MTGDARSRQLIRICAGRGWPQASAAALVPERVADGTQAFMFESSLSWKMSPWAQESCQADYLKAWNGLERHFPKAQ